MVRRPQGALHEIDVFSAKVFLDFADNVRLASSKRDCSAISNFVMPISGALWRRKNYADRQAAHHQFIRMSRFVLHAIHVVASMIRNHRYQIDSVGERSDDHSPCC